MSIANGRADLFKSQQDLARFLQYTRPTGVHSYMNQTDNPDAYDDDKRQQIEWNNRLDYSFTGINNRKEAIEMLKKGYEAPLEHFKKDVHSFFCDKEEIYAYAPSGPRINPFLAQKGVSNCYLRPKSVDSTKTKIVNLCIDTAVPWYVKKEQLERNGIHICQAIKALEKNNYRINLFAGCGTALHNWLEMILVQLKKADQKLNVANLCYPICHPSFLRCVVFEWQDKVEGGRNMGSGRGTPTLNEFSREEVEDFIHRQLGYNVIYINIQDAVSPEKVMEVVRKRANDTRKKRR